jgi:hypothetical protein
MPLVIREIIYSVKVDHASDGFIQFCFTGFNPVYNFVKQLYGVPQDSLAALVPDQDMR